MRKYKKDLVPQARGLVNNGVLCYLNSLVQCLVSLPQFMEILALPENCGAHISNILKSIANGSVNNTFEIIKLLHPIIKNGRQEDVQETFQVLLSLFKKVDDIFHVRYETTIECQCGENRKLAEEPPEVWIDFPEYVNDTKEFENFIKLHKSVVPDFRCDRCGKVGTSSTVRRLKRLSEIIVVVLKNKYLEKRKQFFPQKMTFNSFEGPLKYRIVAKIDHFGSMGGGHYTCTCLRNSSKDSNKSAMMDKLRAVYNTTPDPGVKKLCAEKYKALSAEISCVEINDSTYEYVASINPEAETYILFYSLC